MRSPQKILQVKDNSKPDPELWNHLYDFAFQLESEEEDPIKALRKQKKEIMLAVITRLINVFDSEEYLEAFGCCDSYKIEP